MTKRGNNSKDGGKDKVKKSVQSARSVPYMPDGYKIDGDTLYRVNDEEKTPICDPLYVEALARDDEGGNWGRLLIWQDRDGRRHEWAMPNAMLAGDGAVYRGILLDQGLGIRAGKKAQNALHDYIQAANPLARAVSVSMPGWHGGRYVAPDGTVYGTGSDGRFLLQVNGMLPKLEKQGTLESWKEGVAAYAPGNSRLVLAISAALAGPLLRHVNEGSGGFHYAGGSSTGKTTALLAAASVWGMAERSWRTTDNAAESWARFANDGFLAIDELGQVDGKAADAMAYMLGNGQGKGRSSRDGIARDTAEFRLMFLSTGEIGLADKMREVNKRPRAGQAVRMLEIPADAGAGFGMFENLHGRFSGGDQFAKYLGRTTAEHKGHAASAFLKNLAAMESGQIRLAIMGIKNEWLATNVPDNADGQVQRAAHRFALVAAAGTLATRWGIVPWPEDEASTGAARCFRDWLDTRGGTASHEVLDGLRSIVVFTEQHGSSRFSDFDHPDARPIINRAGFRRKHSSGSGDDDFELEFMLFPEVFRSEILNGSRTQKDIIKAAVETGLIMTAGGRNNTVPVKLPGLGRKRVIRVFPSRYRTDDAAGRES